MKAFSVFLKKNFFMRLFALLMAVLFCVLSLVACRQTPLLGSGIEKSPASPAPSPQGSASQLLSEQAVKKPVIERRFDGEVLRIFTIEDGRGQRNGALNPQDDLSDPLNAAILARNERIFEELGVRIENLRGTFEDYQKLKDAGELQSFDLLEISRYDLYNNGLETSHHPALFAGEGSVFDLDAPYLDPLFYDLACQGRCEECGISTLATDCTAFSGHFGYSLIGSYGVTVVNRALFDKYKKEIAALPGAGGLSDPIALVREGRFTLDLLNKLAALFEEKGEQMLLAYGDTQGEESADLLAAGAGVSALSSDLAEDLDDEQTGMRKKEQSAFLKAVHSLFSSDSTTVLNLGAAHYTEEEPGYTARYTPLFEEFKKGKTLMTVCSLDRVRIFLSDMKEGYYILPLPVQSREQALETGYVVKSQARDHSCFVPVKGIDEGRYPMIAAVLALGSYYGYTEGRAAYLQAISDPVAMEAETKQLEALLTTADSIDYFSLLEGFSGNVRWYTGRAYGSALYEWALDREELRVRAMAEKNYAFIRYPLYCPHQK